MFKIVRAHKYFFLIWLVGLCAAIVINLGRMHAEDSNHAVEMVYDYGRLAEYAPKEGKTIDEALALFKKAGVTSFALYDETPETLKNDGFIQIYDEQEAIRTGLITDANQPSEMFYIIAGSGPRAKAYFEEALEEIQYRLPRKCVSVLTLTNGEKAVQVKGIPLDSFLETHLGVSETRIKEIKENGFGVVARPTNIANLNRKMADYFLSKVTRDNAVHAVMFTGQSAFGYPSEHLYVADKLKAAGIPLVLIEASNQLQFDKQAGAIDMLKHNNYYGVRAYSMIKDELVQLPVEEASQRYFISDVERNIRLNYFPGYKRPRPGDTLLESDLRAISLIGQKLQNRGFILGRPGIMETYWPSKWLQLGVLAGIMSLCSLAFHVLTGLSEKKSGLLGLLGWLVLGSGVLLQISPVLARQIAALLTALSVPVTVMYVMMNWWKSFDFNEVQSKAKLFGTSLLGLVAATLFSITGGWLLGAILADTGFMLELEIFRGVKLAFVLPVLLVIILYLRTYPTILTAELTTHKDWYRFTKKFLRIPVRMGSLLLAAFIGLAGLIFVGRSGHTSGIPVPGVEVALRRGLEALLYARPRVKEFLIGQPALVLIPFVLRFKWPQWLHFLMVLAAGIAQASVVETFAHMRSPVIMSTVRGLNGMLFGGAIGIVLALCCYLVPVLTWFWREHNAKE